MLLEKIIQIRFQCSIVGFVWVVTKRQNYRRDVPLSHFHPLPPTFELSPCWTDWKQWQRLYKQRTRLMQPTTVVDLAVSAQSFWERAARLWVPQVLPLNEQRTTQMERTTHLKRISNRLRIQRHTKLQKIMC